MFEKLNVWSRLWVQWSKIFCCTSRARAKLQSLQPKHATLSTLLGWHWEIFVKIFHNLFLLQYVHQNINQLSDTVDRQIQLQTQAPFIPLKPISTGGETESGFVWGDVRKLGLFCCVVWGLFARFEVYFLLSPFFLTENYHSMHGKFQVLICIIISFLVLLLFRAQCSVTTVPENELFFKWYLF